MYVIRVKVKMSLLRNTDMFGIIITKKISYFIGRVEAPSKK